MQGLEASLIACTSSALTSANPALGERLSATLVEALSLADAVPVGRASTATGRASPPQRSAHADIVSTLFGAISAADPVVTDRALSVLLTASVDAPHALLRHAAAARVVLEQLPELEAQQARAACQVFARMIVAEGATGEMVIDSAAFPFAAAVQQRYSTGLGSCDAAPARVAVTGMLEWLMALALAGPEQAEQAKNLLEAMFGQVGRQPEVLAFTFQTLAHMLLAHLRSGGHFESVRSKAPNMVHYVGAPMP